MAHLYKKVKKGHEYFYIRETQRVYGKPTTINQVYLGTADKVESVLGQGGFSPKEFGSIFAINEIDRAVDLAGIINEILPPKKRVRGPSLGELVFYAALNRAIAPTSKRQLASWYETTDIQRIRPLRLESLNSQNFWNHWDRISEADLEKIKTAFFKKVFSLLPVQKYQLIIEAVNISSPPKPSAFVGMPEADQDFLAEHYSQQQLGLAVVTERRTRIPFYYQSLSGGLPVTGFYDLMEHLLAKVASLGVASQNVTLLINQEMDVVPVIARLDAKDDMHFLVSYPADFMPELTEISLKEFRPLPEKSEAQFSHEDEKILYYETRARVWDRDRRVIITFDPKSFHKSYQELGKKVQKVRKEMANLQQRYAQKAAPENAADFVKTQLAQLCHHLKISPALFQLNFVEAPGQFRFEFQLDHQQMAKVVRQFGKNVIITDHEDWTAEEIYDTCITQAVLGPELGNGKASNGNRFNGNGKDNRSLFQKALLPLYHWTDSKIQVHLFVCVAALTYLNLLWHQLDAAGLDITPDEAVEELRALRTAIYLKGSEGKLKRMLGEINDQQSAILKTLGYGVQEGQVTPLEGAPDGIA
jgi:transposase